jgi:hypothetical protein
MKALCVLSGGERRERREREGGREREKERERYRDRRDGKKRDPLS